MKAALALLVILVVQGTFADRHSALLGGHNPFHKHHGENKSLSATAPPVHLELYWESLCPDSIRFIVKQLKPAFEKVKDIFAIKLYPYGKATSTKSGDTWTFECQHGPNECQGNLLLACAVTLYPKTEEILPFIFCVESDSSPQTAGQKCAAQTGLEWNTLNQCVNSNVGSQLLYNNGEVTQHLSPALNYVPWIVVDGQHTAEINTEAETDLVSLVCKRYQGDQKPDACSSFIKRYYKKMVKKFGK